MKIPFMPFPIKTANKLKWLGKLMLKVFPGLKSNIYQSDLKIDPLKYASLIVPSSIFWFNFIFSLIYVTGYIAGYPNLYLSLFSGLLFSVFSFFYLLNYPKYLISKKVRLLEKDLLHVLQQILIQVRSGVDFFEAMVGVSSGYGELSKVFRKIVKKINAGVNETEAIEYAIKKNPSFYLRRALWQISNAIKTGTDIGDTLEDITKNLIKDHSLSIRKYGQELNPLMMIYMLFSIVFPSLSITFLILISTITGFSIPNSILAVILLFMLIFQIFYLGLVKSRRPVMEV